MASSQPVSLDTSGSADEKFRQLTKRMASEINGFGARRQKAMQTPPQHTFFKQKIRSLIGDKPTGYYDNPRNRGAFWKEIDQILGTVKPLGTEWHKEWLRALTEVITEYRVFATELLNGATTETKEKEGEEENPEAQKWEDFKSFLQNSSQTLNQSESSDLSEFYRNMTALTDSVIKIYSTPKEGDAGQQEAENLVCEMLQAFEYLRTNEGLSNKKEAYRSGLAVLRHMTEKGMVLEYFREFLEQEVTEFGQLMAQLPPPTLVSELQTEAPISEPDSIVELEPKLVTEPQPEAESAELQAWAEELSEENRGERECAEKPEYYGHIDRLDKPAQKEEVRRLAEDFSRAIDAAPDSDRIRRLFRHNVHEFMDAMTEVIADLIQREDRSILGEQLTDYLERSQKGAFITFIADALINKIGKPTLRIAQNCDSDEDFYEDLQAETNNFGETGFESAALLTFCAIIGCKGGDMFAILRKDWNAKEKIWREMSQIDARSFAERGQEEDLQGGSDHEFVLSEADWLIRCVENGCDPNIEGDEFDEETETEAEAVPVVELRQVPDMVQKLAWELNEIEIRCGQIAESKKGLLARMANIDEEIFAEQNLEQLKAQEAELKAKMPDFENEEFVAWTQTVLALGERKRNLQNRVAARSGGTINQEEFEDEKLCLEEDLAGADYDLKEAREAIRIIKDKLWKIGNLCI